MRTRSMTVAAAACAVAAAALMAGCGPKGTPTAGQSPVGGAVPPVPAASPAPSAQPTHTVKDIPAGNCTIYTKPDAVALLGGVNMNNKMLNIQTGGGTRIDVCSYLNVSLRRIEGTSYGVVRYDSPATAFAAAKKVRTDMFGSAADHNWDVQSLAASAPGAGQVLGGYGTKTDSGMTFTLAIVGTNVGPYLVTALGASSVSPDNAKKFALTVFKALASATA